MTDLTIPQQKPHLNGIINFNINKDYWIQKETTIKAKYYNKHNYWTHRNNMIISIGNHKSN